MIALYYCFGDGDGYPVKELVGIFDSEEKIPDSFKEWSEEEIATHYRNYRRTRERTLEFFLRQKLYLLDELETALNKFNEIDDWGIQFFMVEPIEINTIVHRDYK